MIHRHIDDELDMSIPAIEDVILRGSFEDQRRACPPCIADDPFGEAAYVRAHLNAIPEELWKLRHCSVKVSQENEKQKQEGDVKWLFVWRRVPTRILILTRKERKTQQQENIIHIMTGIRPCSRRILNHKKKPKKFADNNNRSY